MAVEDVDITDLLFLGTGAADWPVEYAPSADEGMNGLARRPRWNGGSPDGLN